MTREIAIIDFEDSFTYNIAAEFLYLSKKLGLNPNIRVIGIKDALLFLKGAIDKYSDEKSLDRHHRLVLVYGPGPGHPKEYRDFFPFIKQLLLLENIFHLGICLGHQILWQLQGFETIRSNNPIHGQKVEMAIPAWRDHFNRKYWGRKVWVQCYNSLVVNVDQNYILPRGNKIYFHKGYCFASAMKRVLTYQFHPESVGTSFRSPFLLSPLNYLYYNC